MPLRASLSFNERNHSYHYGDKHIPGVTTVLSKTRYPIPPYVRKLPVFINATKLGSEVHRLTEEADSGLPLFFDDYQPEAVGKLRLWQQWLEEQNATIKQVEMMVVSDKYWYCGTLDRIVEIDGKVYVVDIKTSKLDKRGRIQVVAYVIAATEMGIKVDGGILVSLKGEEAKHKVCEVGPLSMEWFSILKEYKEQEMDNAVGNYFG